MGFKNKYGCARTGSRHFVKNTVVPGELGLYYLTLADFGTDRCNNSLVFISQVVREWQDNPPIISYYANLDPVDDKMKCAKVISCWLDKESRKILGKVRVEGRFARTLTGVIKESRQFNLGILGTYDSKSSDISDGKECFYYTAIHGLRFIFPDIR